MGWLSLLWLWKQGTVYSLVLGEVGSPACWPAEADPHTVPGWAHVVCALYIPEVQFANVLTMEPIVLQYVPHDRFNKVSGPSLVPFLAYCVGVPPLCFLALLGNSGDGCVLLDYLLCTDRCMPLLCDSGK